MALLASMLVLAICRAGGQSAVMRNSATAQKPAATLSAGDRLVHKGLFTVDVAVSDAAGNPVADLAPWDFTLLDNGQRAKIRTFGRSSARSEPAPELIFVLDSVNLTGKQLEEAESGIIRFLRRNGGRLDFPCLLYRLTQDGLVSSLRPEKDGALMVKELEGERSLWTVWRANGRVFNSVGSWDSGLPRNRLSLDALGSIAIAQRDVPGHKVVVWMGPGWPVNGGNGSFNEATELSTRLREARITLVNVNVWASPEVSDADGEVPQSRGEMQPARLALQGIARRTGGLVLESAGDADGDGDLDRAIARCVAEVRNSYSLTFNPPRTDTMDEYHEIEVKVDRAGLAARALTGYYNEPVYFDHPQPGVERVTVAQLVELVHGKTDLLRRLENIELMERLSTPRLDALLHVVHGERERQALRAAADLSIALPPPADDVVDRAPPSLAEQRAMVRQTFEYLQDVIPRLPDFYALRNMARFEEPSARADESWKMPHQDQSLHFATGEHATVHYRNGSEEVERKQKLAKGRAVNDGARRLETWGTFGPILSYVLTAATGRASSLTWERWERGGEGDVAVFSYRASPEMLYEVTYCCLPEGNGTTLYINKTGIYGEFAVDPKTGGILRIVVHADLDEERDPDVPLIRSELMVEYGAQKLGDKFYLCPQRSVNLSRGRSVRVLQEWGMVFRVYGYFETMINDVSFGGYHKFGSEARILPEFEEAEDMKGAGASKGPH